MFTIVILSVSLVTHIAIHTDVRSHTHTHRHTDVRAHTHNHIISHTHNHRNTHTHTGKRTHSQKVSHTHSPPLACSCCCGRATPSGGRWARAGASTAAPPRAPE